MKTIAKVIDYEIGDKFDFITIDTPVPAIIHYPNTYEYVHGEVSKIRGNYPIGTVIEIESTFHQAGEMLNGHTINHDCYSRKIKVIG